ncbi:NADP-dependent alcohol dehydrogenase [Bacillus licheniformis WX-02]|nr:NADP-dependent alcohol dehydrogenase [Bacillus licheniformis WX-02]
MCNLHKTISTRVLSAPRAKAKFEQTTIERR